MKKRADRETNRSGRYSKGSSSGDRPQYSGPPSKAERAQSKNAAMKDQQQRSAKKDGAYKTPAYHVAQKGSMMEGTPRTAASMSNARKDRGSKASDYGVKNK